MTTSGGGAGPLHRSNHRIKRLRRLASQRRARSEERAFVVEGPALVAEALTVVSDDPAVTIEGLYVELDQSAELAADASELGIAVHDVAPGVLGSALDTVNPQPVVAVVSRPAASVADLGIGGEVLVAVDARDPGNVGTLIRSAEAAGAAGVVLAGHSVDPTNPKVLRAAAGAGLRLPVITESDLGVALQGLRATGRPVVATVVTPDAVPYTMVRLTDTAILLGNERHGLPPNVIDAADVAVTIPLAGPTESLNLGVAGSLICFEALRQRRSGVDTTG
ncbi:MAG: RNA methyltransferase [Actinomycetota bacterium]